MTPLGLLNYCQYGLHVQYFIVSFLVLKLEMTKMDEIRPEILSSL